MRVSSSVRKKFFAHVSLIFLAFSLLTVTVFAVPAHSLRHHVSGHVLAEHSRPKSAGHAQLRTCIAKFGYLAKSDANTRYEPNEFDTSVDDDTMLIGDPDHKNSDISKTTNENTGQFGVLTVFESSVLHVSHDDFALQNRKQRKHAIGKPLLDREKQKKEKVL